MGVGLGHACPTATCPSAAATLSQVVSQRGAILRLSSGRPSQEFVNGTAQGGVPMVGGWGYWRTSMAFPRTKMSSSLAVRNSALAGREEAMGLELVSKTRATTTPGKCSSRPVNTQRTSRSNGMARRLAGPRPTPLEQSDHCRTLRPDGARERNSNRVLVSAGHPVDLLHPLGTSYISDRVIGQVSTGGEWITSTGLESRRQAQRLSQTSESRTDIRLSIGCTQWCDPRSLLVRQTKI